MKPAGATDVSVGSPSTGLAGETYTALSKTLLYSDDGFQKLEGLALGPELAGGGQALLGVVDAGGATAPIHSFVRWRVTPLRPSDETVGAGTRGAVHPGADSASCSASAARFGTLALPTECGRARVAPHGGPWLPVSVKGLKVIEFPQILLPSAERNVV